MKNGWIPLYRKIRNHWIWKNPYYYRAWTDILMTADRREGGTIQYSYRWYSRRWDMSPKAVRIFIKKLIDDNMLEVIEPGGFKKGHNGGAQCGAKLKVCNYEKYVKTGAKAGAQSRGNNTTIKNNNNTYNKKNNLMHREFPKHKGEEKKKTSSEKHDHFRAKPKGSAHAYSEKFEKIWSLYPRKIAKKAAYKNFLARLKEGISYNDLLKAVKNYKLSINGTEERFIMHATTFFGPNERWKDYLAVPIRTSSVDDWRQYYH